LPYRRYRYWLKMAVASIVSVVSMVASSGGDHTTQGADSV
jgi:hypothetical protein